MESHILKHRGMIHRPAQHRYTVADPLCQRCPHQRQPVQKTMHVILCLKISCSGAQMRQIASQRTHIFGDGHFVVVQDHQQIVQFADVVHPLIEGAISNHCRDDPRFSPQFLGPSHADRS